MSDKNTFSWKDLKKPHRALRDTDDPAAQAAAWQDFVKISKGLEGNAPRNVSFILDELSKIDKKRSDIYILDHGCGGGLTCYFLIALGYEKVFGVDVSEYKLKSNDFLPNLPIENEQVIFHYDGKNLPFPDNHFDLIYSQQVVEHITDDVLDDYYREEGRVLKPGGVAYHQVPHRLTPYEAHVEAWFVHWLPRRITIFLLKLMKKNTGKFEEGRINLRSPFTHFRLAKKYIGPTENHTKSRVANLNLEGYDGPTSPRRIIMSMCRVPVIGDLVLWIMTYLIMLETTSYKSN